MFAAADAFLRNELKTASSGFDRYIALGCCPQISAALAVPALTRAAANARLGMGGSRCGGGGSSSGMAASSAGGAHGSSAVGTASPASTSSTFGEKNLTLLH